MKRTPLQRRTPLAVRKGLRSYRPGEGLRTYAPKIKPRIDQPRAVQRRWRELVRSLGSVVSGLPAEIHHPVGRTGRHNGVAIGHWWLIPLTWEEHQGAEGIHSHPNRRRREKELFRLVLGRVVLMHNGERPECYPPAHVIEAIEDYHL